MNKSFLRTKITAICAILACSFMLFAIPVNAETEEVESGTPGVIDFKPMCDLPPALNFD